MRAPVSDLPRLLLCCFDVVPAPTAISRRLTEYLKGLSERYQVVVLTVKTPDHTHIERYQGARLLRVPVGSGDLAARVQAFDRAVRRQLESEEYVMVHFFDPFGGYALCERRGDYGYKLVYDACSLPSVELPLIADADEANRRFIARVRRQELFCLMNADLVIVANEVTRDYVCGIGVPAEQVQVILPPVDLAPYAPSVMGPPDGTPMTLLHLGNLSDANDLPLVLEAIAESAAELKLVIVGQPNAAHQAALEQQAAALGISERVTFQPPVVHDDLHKVLAAADVGLLSMADVERNSRVGSPLSRLGEYLAAGRPVIAANTPASRAVLPEEGVVRYEAGDKAGLIAALQELASDPARRVTLGEEARQASRAWDGAKLRADLVASYVLLSGTGVRAVGDEEAASADDVTQLGRSLESEDTQRRRAAKANDPPSGTTKVKTDPEITGPGTTPDASNGDRPPVMGVPLREEPPVVLGVPASELLDDLADLSARSSLPPPVDTDPGSAPNALHAMDDVARSSTRTPLEPQPAHRPGGDELGDDEASPTSVSSPALVEEPARDEGGARGASSAVPRTTQGARVGAGSAAPREEGEGSRPRAAATSSSREGSSAAGREAGADGARGVSPISAGHSSPREVSSAAAAPGAREGSDASRTGREGSSAASSAPLLREVSSAVGASSIREGGDGMRAGATGREGAAASGSSLRESGSAAGASGVHEGGGSLRAGEAVREGAAVGASGIREGSDAARTGALDREGSAAPRALREGLSVGASGMREGSDAARPGALDREGSAAPRALREGSTVSASGIREGSDAARTGALDREGSGVGASGIRDGSDAPRTGAPEREGSAAPRALREGSSVGASGIREGIDVSRAAVTGREGSAGSDSGIRVGGDAVRTSAIEREGATGHHGSAVSDLRDGSTAGAAGTREGTSASGAREAADASRPGVASRESSSASGVSRADGSRASAMARDAAPNHDPARSSGDAGAGEALSSPGSASSSAARAAASSPSSAARAPAEDASLPRAGTSSPEPLAATGGRLGVTPLRATSPSGVRAPPKPEPLPSFAHSGVPPSFPPPSTPVFIPPLSVPPGPPIRSSPSQVPPPLPRSSTSGVSPRPSTPVFVPLLTPPDQKPLPPPLPTSRPSGVFPTVPAPPAAEQKPRPSGLFPEPPKVPPAVEEISEEEIESVDDLEPEELSGDDGAYTVDTDSSPPPSAIDPWLAQLVFGYCPPESGLFNRHVPPTTMPGRDS